MGTLGFDAGERAAVLRVLAFLLKLGNVTFEPRPNIDGSLGLRVHHSHGEARPGVPAAFARHADRPRMRRAGGGVRASGRRRDRVCGRVGSGGALRLRYVSPVRLRSRQPWPSRSMIRAAMHADGCADEEEEAGEGAAGEAAAWARARCDRVLRALYARLFTWLVDAVNAAIAVRVPLVTQVDE